jgi:hypothetical protein
MLVDPWRTIEQDTAGEPLPLAQDPAGNWVFCSREVWQQHILARHPEIDALRDLIPGAITSPYEIEPDPEDERVVRYYANIPPDRQPFRRPVWLRVVVKYVYPPERGGERTGLLSSVYLIRRKE